MVRLPRRLLAVLVGLVLLLAALPAVLPAAGAQSELEAARAELAAARSRVADAQARADAAAAALSDAETRLAEVEAELERLDDAVAAGEAEVASMRDDLREIAVDRYLGAADTPTVLSGTDTIAEAVRADALMEVVTGRNADVLDRFRLITADLETMREDAAARRVEQEAALAELTARTDEIAAELADLEQEQRSVQAIVGRLEEEERRRIAEEEARRRAEEEARRQEAQRQATEAARREAASRPTSTTVPRTGAPTPGPGPTTTTSPPRIDTPTAPIATGDWVCPVQGAVSFTDSWGAPRSGGRRHQGVDMMAANGTPAVAPVSGVVTHRDNSIGGLSYHLNGDDGNYYYGTHLSAYGNSGRVQAGTIIGYVGATGNATTPHLHFEIHPGGRGNPVNPYPTVRAAC
jgi:murein DD-endopeptidase MepM/ murein hydrolase activator NlpD